jgi:hypothetical protein
MDQLDLTNRQACGFHNGPMKQPCHVCGQPYRAHWPELDRSQPRRTAIVDDCSVCSYPVDSNQHLSSSRTRPRRNAIIASRDIQAR